MTPSSASADESTSVASSSTDASTSLSNIRAAIAAEDTQAATLILRIVLDDLHRITPSDSPLPEYQDSFPKFVAEMRSKGFAKKSPAEQKAIRQQRIERLESNDVDPPLPTRYQVGEVIDELYDAGTHFSRSCLLYVILAVPLVYGPWKALKRIFKTAEAAGDMQIYGALSARFDMELDRRPSTGNSPDVSVRTLAYLCRRGWRTLRRVGETLPSCYADAATDFLRWYDDSSQFRRSWIYNHILYHETGNYAATRFLFGRYQPGTGRIRQPAGEIKHRAFLDAWQRSPRPLFTLLENARSELVRQFATAALKTDFRAALRDVEPAWVARLATAESVSVHEFVVWILSNVPKFEQCEFSRIGLTQCSSAAIPIAVEQSSQVRGRLRSDTRSRSTARTTHPTLPELSR